MGLLVAEIIASPVSGSSDFLKWTHLEKIRLSDAQILPMEG